MSVQGKGEGGMLGKHKANVISDSLIQVDRKIQHQGFSGNGILFVI